MTFLEISNLDQLELELLDNVESSDDLLLSRVRVDLFVELNHMVYQLDSVAYEVLMLGDTRFYQSNVAFLIRLGCHVKF